MPTGLTVSSAPQTGTVGEPLGQPLRVTVTDQDGKALKGATVRWSVLSGGGSTAPDSSMTDALGAAEAVFTLGPLAGEQVAVATLNATSSARFTVTATGGAPASIVIQRDSLRFTALGDTAHLSSTVKDDYGNVLAGTNVVWTTSSAAVVSVTAGGIAESRAPGVAELRGAAGAARVVLPVRVSPTPAALTLTPAQDTLRSIAATLALQAVVVDANGNAVQGARVTYSTSDATVATVDSAGTVTARAPGTVTVEAVSGSARSQALIVVRPEVARIELLPAADTLTALGDTARLAARAIDTNGFPVAGATIEFQSSAATIATVDGAGLVRAIAPGTATITARSHTASQSANILVRQKVARVAISSSPDTMRSIGSTAPLSAEVKDANGHVISGAAVSWSSLDPAIGSVNSAGVVAAAARGDVRIVGTSDGRADTVTISVIPWGRISLSMELNRWEIYDVVFPILKKYGMTANVEVITGWVGNAGRLTLSQIRDLHTAGWAVVPHSIRLTDLTLLSDAEMRHEILGSKAWVVDNGFRGAETFIVPLHIAGEREWNVIKANFVAARSRGYEAVYEIVTWPPEDPYSVSALQGEDYIDTAAQRAYMLGLARKVIHEGLLLEIFFHRVRSGQAGVFEAFISELAKEKEYVKTFAELFED